MRLLKRLRWPIAIFGIILSSALIYLSIEPHWIKIEVVQLELAPNSTQDLLYQRIKTSLMPQLQHYTGKFFWDVPLEKVYQMTMSDRRIKKVSVYREFPSRLRIEIEPHTPVLAYLSQDNRVYPVANDATLLPALSLKDIPDLPVLRGEELKNEQALRETAISLYDSIPAEGILKKKAVSEISYSKKDGFKVFVSGASSEIKMGDQDFSPKISRVEKVLAYLESQNIKGRVIDARFEKKVVVRVRKAP